MPKAKISEKTENNQFSGTFALIEDRLYQIVVTE
jgi:hypothetical protein